MLIKANDRVLLAGQTGSGKTYFAHKALKSIPRLIVIDSKANMKRWGLRVPTKRDWRRFEQGESGRFRIVPPITDDLPGWFEELFSRLYEIGNLTIYIDEAYGVTPPRSSPGKWLSALYTRGRERGIGMWAATQRPTFIPLFLISEADWLIVFRLNLEEDRKRLASIAGEKVKETIPDPHGFYLYHVGAETPRYYKTTVLKRKTVV